MNEAPAWCRCSRGGSPSLMSPRPFGDMTVTKRKTCVTSARDLGEFANPYRGMTLAQLQNVKAELSRLHTTVNLQAIRLRELLSMVEEETNRVGDKYRRVRITDHAIVRFLERYTTCDIAFAEAEIIEMIEQGRKEVVVSDGLVVTVLPEGTQGIAPTAKEPAVIAASQVRTVGNGEYMHGCE
jgi:hypothetical protein